jgi:transketolase
MEQIKDLEEKANRVRLQVLEAAAAGGMVHFGGTYSCTDLMVALYYGGLFNINPKNPGWAERDRFLIGKGHACLALYAILLDLGIMSQEIYDSYGTDGGLGCQLDINIPGVEYNTGSLGHVLGIASGIALAAKLDSKNYRSYALLGDAECYEGSIWEAIIFAGEQGLNKLVGIIDRNRLSVLDNLEDQAFFRAFPKSAEAFGWDCYEIDGHSFSEILDSFRQAQSAKNPVMIIANTIKGKGVSFMENELKYHNGLPGEPEMAAARQELIAAQSGD